MFMFADLLNTLQFLGLTPENLIPLLLVFIIMDRRIDNKLTMQLDTIRHDLRDIKNKINILERAVVEIQVVLVNAGHKLTQLLHS